MKYAVISDVHGNADALEVVLEHISKNGIDKILCLGDVFYGPFQPEKIMELLMDYNVVYVLGNMDEFLLNKDDKINETRSLILEKLPLKTFDLIKKWEKSKIVDNNIYMCHGNHTSNKEYLLEKVKCKTLVLRSLDEIDKSIHKIMQPIILCGHSHIPRVIESSSGQVIINPGSVGMPCFESENSEGTYASENGASFARYATIEVIDGKLCEISHHTLKYQKGNSIESALQYDRSDYAAWVKTGFRE